MKKSAFLKTLILFAALTIAGVGLVVFGEAAPTPAAQHTLPVVGAALFTSALTYLLVTIADFRRE